MSTVRELIYDVREKLNLTTDDVDITNEYIHHLLNDERAYYIKQKFQDFRITIPESLKQTLKIELELVDSNPGITNGEKILRSKNVLPTLINLGAKNYFVRILSRDYNSIPYVYTSFDRFPYVGKDKWNLNTVYAAIGPDHKLYLKSGMGYENSFKIILVMGIFENPEDAWFNSVEYSPSYNYLDTEYPLSKELSKVVIQSVIQSLGITYQTKEDPTNNATDES